MNILEGKFASPFGQPIITKQININTSEKLKMITIYFNPDTTNEENIFDFLKNK